MRGGFVRSGGVALLSFCPLLHGRLKYLTALAFAPVARGSPRSSFQTSVPRDYSAKMSSSVIHGPGDSAMSQRLWRACNKEAMWSLHNPWVLGLAEGTVSRASFQAYVREDTYFLQAFAKAYAFALTKASDRDGIKDFHSLIGAVLEELELHRSYAHKWGVDIHNLQAPMAPTQHYVDFLLEVAGDAQSSVAQVLASMAPCMRLYAFLGKALRDAFPHWGSSIFADWIQTYSSQDFESAADLVEKLLDKYSADGDFGQLLLLYRKAPATGSGDGLGVGIRGLKDQVSLLCVDFDDTCTSMDTTRLLFGIVAAQQSDPEVRAELKDKWEQLTQAFLDGYSLVLEEALADKSKAPEQCDPDLEGLEALLERLQSVELASLTRVSESKVLSGATRESIHASIKGSMRSQWGVRPGLGTCLTRALQAPFETRILSINWSRDVIFGILEDVLASHNADTPGMSLPITCNDLEFDTQGISTGNVKVAVRGPEGKRRHLKSLAEAGHARGQAGSLSPNGSAPRGLVVFIGDSATDLLAMLEADVGIVVGENKVIRRVTAAFGVPIRPLAAACVEVGRQEAGEAGAQARGPCLYRASSWEEIDVFLFGPQP